jgi:hypothetical protein
MSVKLHLPARGKSYIVSQNKVDVFLLSTAFAQDVLQVEDTSYIGSVDFQTFSGFCFILLLLNSYMFYLSSVMS